VFFLPRAVSLFRFSVLLLPQLTVTLSHNWTWLGPMRSSPSPWVYLIRHLVPHNPPQVSGAAPRCSVVALFTRDGNCTEVWLGPSPVRYAKFESIRYFIDIDILQNCLIDIDIDIDIFQNHHIDIDIDIDIFGITLSISISISIFFRIALSISISISIFFKSVDISTIDISYRYFNKEKE